MKIYKRRRKWFTFCISATIIIISVVGNPSNAQTPGENVAVNLQSKSEKNLFWVGDVIGDTEIVKIQGATLDGKNVVDIVIENKNFLPGDITIDTIGEKMYWKDSRADEIQRANLDGTNKETLVQNVSGGSIALDSTERKIYWYDYASGNIRRANLDGTEIENRIAVKVLYFGVSNLALDEINKKIYWMKDGDIQRANIDGTEIETVVRYTSPSIPGFPLEMVLDTPGGKIYWQSRDKRSQSTFIQRANLDGTNVETVTTLISEFPRGIALDLDQRQIYFGKIDGIYRADLNGNNIKPFVTGLSSGVSLAPHPVDGKLYWTSSQQINRINLDSSGFEVLIPNRLSGSTDLDVDTVDNKIYWADFGIKKILRANLDGTGIEALITTGLGLPRSLTLDTNSKKMYWVEAAKSGKIKRANLDGTQVEELISSGLSSPHGLALDTLKEKMYWIEGATSTIKRANFNGTNIESLISKGLKCPVNIAIDAPRGKMYWSDRCTRKILQANLDGTEIEEFKQPERYGQFGLIVNDITYNATLDRIIYTWKSGIGWVRPDKDAKMIDVISGKNFGSVVAVAPDSEPIIEFLSENSTAINEAVGVHHVSVKLKQPPGIVLKESISFDLIDVGTGTASPNEDYVAISPVKLTFPIGSIGQTTVSYELRINQDSIFEEDETIDLRLTNFHGPGMELSTTQLTHKVIIANDDGFPVANDDMPQTTVGKSILIDITDNDFDEDGMLSRYVANFDGKNDFVTWRKLFGFRSISKFIRFRTNRTRGVLFDVEMGGTPEAGLVITENSLQVRCRFSKSGLQVLNLADINEAANGQWHSAGFVYNGIELRGYFDGRLVGTPIRLNSDTIPHNYVSTCGKRILSPSWFFAGQMSDFVIYEKALSDLEILNYHRNIITINSLKLWGKMDEGNYLKGLKDSSGSLAKGKSYGVSPLLDLVSVIIVQPPLKGSITNPLDGTILYNPGPDSNGEDKFQYQIRDRSNLVSNIATVAISILPNTRPKANDDKVEISKEKSITINVVRNDSGSNGTIDPSSVKIVRQMYAASFDGRNDKIVWGYLGLNDTPTISKFIRFRTTDRSGVLFDAELGAGMDGGMYISGGMLKVRCAFHNAGTRILDMVDDDVAADGNWHSAGFTYDGSTLTPYFDGVVVGSPLSVPDDILRHNYQSTCGGRVLSKTVFFAGELADFIVYNTPLSEADVLNYHNGEVRMDDLVLWGKMDESDYSEGLADSSGNGNIGNSRGAIAIFDPTIPLRPANGTLVNNQDGTVTYTPNVDFLGKDGFEYTVKDNNGLVSNLAKVSLFVNDAPIAEDDKITTTQNHSITVNVIDNDIENNYGINPSTVHILRPRYVARFDGVNDRIVWGDLGLHRTPVLSKFIRFRTTQKRGVLFDAELGAGMDGGLYLDGGTLKVRCAFRNAGIQILDMVDDDIAADGNWHSAGFTYDGSTLTPYFDGVIVGSPLSIPNDTLRHNYQSTCGGRVLSKTVYFAGELSDFVIYDMPLSKTDALTYHEGEIRTNDLVLWGKMDESDYSAGLADVSGNRNTGVSIGAIPVYNSTSPLKPENGVVVNNGDGTVTYSPNPGFFGEYNFNYSVRDAIGAISNIATVTVTVEKNQSPVAVDDEAETGKGESITLNVVENDTDGNGTVDPTTVQIVTPRLVASFDGVNDRIIWGDLGLHRSPVLSKFIRFRTTDKRGVLFDAELGAGMDGGLYLNGGMLRVRCAFHNAGTRILDMVNDNVAADGNWHSAGFTYDGATLIPYFDGVVVGTPLSVSGDTFRHNYPSTCGARVLSKTVFFAGELSDFVVYDVPLSETDVLNYHNSEVRINDLVLWGKMDGGDYSAGMVDASGNGNTGTSFGAIPILDSATPLKPENGIVVNNGDGTVTYTPNSDFIGEDFFEYTVKDGFGARSNFAMVAITVTSPSTATLFSKNAIKTSGESDSILKAFTISGEETTATRTLYEDAEDGTIDGWWSYGDGTLTNIEEITGNRTISTTGQIAREPFRLGLADHRDWDNTKEFTASFTILMEEEAALYFRVDTAEGEKYLCYRPGAKTMEINNNVICFGLGIAPDGQWHTLLRDLRNDLTTALPSSRILAVKDLYIYGSMKIDDVMLLDLGK